MEENVSGIDNLLDPGELRKAFPVAVARVEKWFVTNQKIRGALGNVGADITDMAILSRMVDMIIQFDPRKLYDVFDELGCRIYVSEHPDGQISPGFITYNSMIRESAVANTRVEAEYLSFMKAFELLNKD
jgi:hypothetical protein